jgi:hypothetical protein
VLQNEHCLVELGRRDQHRIIEMFRKTDHRMVTRYVTHAAEKFQEPSFRHRISPPQKLTRA